MPTKPHKRNLSPETVLLSSADSKAIGEVAVKITKQTGRWMSKCAAMRTAIRYFTKQYNSSKGKGIAFEWDQPQPRRTNGRKQTAA